MSPTHLPRYLNICLMADLVWVWLICLFARRSRSGQTVSMRRNGGRYTFQTLHENIIHSSGASLLYKFSSSTKLSEVEAAVKKELESEDVFWHVGRTMGYIQVVLTEKEYSGVSADLVNKLDNTLLSKGLGLRRSKLEASGAAVGPGGFGRSILIFFLSFLIAAATFTFIAARYEGGMSSVMQSFSGSMEGRFAFARFENQSGVVEIGSTSDPAPVQDDNETREFNNPMYSEDTSVLIKKKILEPGTGKLISSSDDSNTSDEETEVTYGVSDQRLMEEISMEQLLD